MATSSHSGTFTGLPEGLTNVKVQIQGVDATSSASTRDASTLDLPDGSNRVYVSAPLLDAGSGAVDGQKVTITCSYLGDGPQEVGSTVTIMGYSCKCTASDVEYAVGELMKCSATYVAIEST